VQGFKHILNITAGMIGLCIARKLFLRKEGMARGVAQIRGGGVRFCLVCWGENILDVLWISLEMFGY
jgi:hypothetical protein